MITGYLQCPSENTLGIGKARRAKHITIAANPREIASIDGYDSCCLFAPPTIRQQVNLEMSFAFALVLFSLMC